MAVSGNSVRRSQTWMTFSGGTSAADASWSPAETDSQKWLDKFSILPCQEAAWMTCRNGRYYLQYATPGTVTQWYCDTVMEGDSATDPFHQVDYAPVSMKIGGFMGSAGHSCVFQDRYGNWWRVTTMWIGIQDLFERRLGLFPVGFDADGRMFTETALGDYPQVMADGPRDPKTSPLANWWVQSFGKLCSASSVLAGHAPELSADENCRTWWSAQTGNAGEWFQLDLGNLVCVAAVQVNFAEQDCILKPIVTSREFQRYRLMGTIDGQKWQSLSASGAHRQMVSDVRESIGPHDYLAFEVKTMRWLRVENDFTPGGGKFAIRDLRVFGPAAGDRPQAVSELNVLRRTDDDRNVMISWISSTNADGYLVRFGVAPDKLYQTIQLQGCNHTKLTTHVLNRGVKYSWRVDAFNNSGFSSGPIIESK